MGTTSRLKTFALATALSTAMAGLSLALATPAAATAIDPYPSSDPVHGCYGGDRPGVAEFRNMISIRIGGWGGIYSCRYISGTTKWSDHADGRAFDWMMSAYNANDVAKVNTVLTWLTRG